MLRGKFFLIVLDNLWNEYDKDWQKLKSFLDYGGCGSKLLITTRSQKVASLVRGNIYSLDRLSDGVCWSILQKKVGGAEVLTQNMIRIGKDIATKCKGLPLAAISLGSLMYSKRDEASWSAILNDNSLWDE